MCISPNNIPHPNGNGRITVPCAKCIECLVKKRKEWTFRLSEERKTCKSAHFITLTYDDENMVYANTLPTLYKPDLQMFIKRLRKQNTKQWKNKIKYYAVGEYGTETERPHYHAIMFNVHPNITKDLLSIWKKGLTHIGNVSPASIRYLTKYVINRYKEYPDREKPFNIISNGIGKKYVKRAKKYHVQNRDPNVKMDNGSKTPMPRYLKDKIFSKHDKLMMQLEVQEALDELEKKQRKKHGSNFEPLRVDGINHRINQLNKKLNKKDRL